MRTLQIVESAYRATLEEQDDPVLWITRAMREAGASFEVLLCGNAVNYAVVPQGSPRLQIGTWRQAWPPCPPADVAALIASGVPVHAVAEDVAARGLSAAALVADVSLIARASLPALFAGFGRIWRW